jgi:hypothetical protein
MAFESTLADLATIRGRMAAGGFARYGGPYVISAGNGSPAGACDIGELDKTMQTVAALSRSMAHDLREGLAVGEEEYLRRLRLAALSPDLPAGVGRDDIEFLAPVRGGTEAGTVVRLLDTLLLGTDAGDPARQLDAAVGVLR